MQLRHTPRRTLNSVPLACAILTYVLILGACAPSPRRAVVALVDFSGSHSTGTDADVSLIADVIVPAMGTTDELTVFPIDDASVREPARILEVDMARATLRRLSDGVVHADEVEAARRRIFLDSMSRAARETITRAALARRRFATKTDILGAILTAARSVRRTDTTVNTAWVRTVATVVGDPLYITTTVLVIASDMLQDGRGIDFTHDPPTVASIPTLLARLRAADEIPDLAGVDVIVSGATGGTATQVEHVRAFWMQYFSAANARVIAYDFDARTAARRYLIPDAIATPVAASSR